MDFCLCYYPPRENIRALCHILESFIQKEVRRLGQVIISQHLIFIEIPIYPAQVPRQISYTYLILLNCIIGCELFTNREFISKKQ